MNITTQQAIANIRQFATREQVQIGFSDEVMTVRCGRKSWNIPYTDSLGSLVLKHNINQIVDWVRVKFQ